MVRILNGSFSLDCLLVPTKILFIHTQNRETKTTIFSGFQMLRTVWNSTFKKSWFCIFLDFKWLHFRSPLLKKCQHKLGLPPVKHLCTTVGIWNLTIWNPEFLKVRFQKLCISNGWALAMAISLVPTIRKPGHFCQDFKWFYKMAAIWPDFKWLDFWISDPNQNPDHLQPNLFSTIQNPDFRSPPLYTWGT